MFLYRSSLSHSGTRLSGSLKRMYPTRLPIPLPRITDVRRMHPWSLYVVLERSVRSRIVIARGLRLGIANDSLEVSLYETNRWFSVWDKLAIGLPISLLPLYIIIARVWTTNLFLVHFSATSLLLLFSVQESACVLACWVHCFKRNNLHSVLIQIFLNIFDRSLHRDNLGS